MTPAYFFMPSRAQTIITTPRQDVPFFQNPDLTTHSLISSIMAKVESRVCPIRVKNKTPAPIQITADQILYKVRHQQAAAASLIYSLQKPNHRSHQTASIAKQKNTPTLKQFYLLWKFLISRLLGEEGK